MRFVHREVDVGRLVCGTMLLPRKRTHSRVEWVNAAGCGQLTFLNSACHFDMPCAVGSRIDGSGNILTAVGDPGH